MANTVAATKNSSTCGPPTRSSDRLAPKPIGGEERDHQRRLQRGVELEQGDALRAAPR